MVTLQLVKNNFRFLKVGPELTFDFYQAIKKMEKIEDTNCNQKSNISYEFYKTINISVIFVVFNIFLILWPLCRN